MNNKLFSSIYYSPNNPASFASKEKLLHEARKYNNSITVKDVKDWLQSQTTYTLHKPVRRRFKRNRIVVKNINEQFQADLVDLRAFSRFNNGYQYLLTVIDIFSKFAFVIPLKTKSSKDVCTAFKKIFSTRKPLKLQTDKGKEFLNKDFEKMCQELRINFFTSNDGEIKCAVIERFNRTLKEKMWKYFTYKGSRKYIDVLESIVTAYNNTIHSSTKMRPSEVTENNSNKVFQNLYGFRNFRDYFKNRKNKVKLKVGDSVRMKYETTPLQKGYYPNWTDEAVNVENIIKGDYKPYVQLSNIKGRFYPEEVQQISKQIYRIEKIIRRRKKNGVKECLIKWLGYPTSFNTWEPETNIIYGSTAET